jgi:hypothetical protein
VVYSFWFLNLSCNKSDVVPCIAWKQRVYDCRSCSTQTAIPVSFVTVIEPSPFKTVRLASHILLKLLDRTSVWKPTYKPKTISAKAQLA